MRQKNIPCLVMRGGTSRGLYFNRAEMPQDQDALAKTLIAAVGAGHPLNIDGMGGGNAVTTKVAMLSPSKDPWADVDYFFAQVSVEEEKVDFAPTCGNILAGVGPAALEMGLVPFGGDTSTVKILSVNTGARVEAQIQTPADINGRYVQYDGKTSINGVNGTAAPVVLNFMDVIGSKTDNLFPTGHPIDTIDGYKVSCVDAAMPMVIARALDFGVTGYESRDALNDNKALFAKFEPLRIKAGRMMGLGDVTGSVIPKFALLAAPQQGGAIAARYFMPWSAHPAMAVTGSICIGACLLAPDTIAAGLARIPASVPTPLCIEHPSGVIDVLIDHSQKHGAFDLKTAGLLRTARHLMTGQVCVPSKAC